MYVDMEIGHFIKKKYNRKQYLTSGERHKNKLELQRKWRAQNKEKVRAYSRKYAQERRDMHLEELREYKHTQYLKHREYYIKKSRLWRLHNRARYNKKQRDIYHRHIELNKKPKCIGCECLLKEKETLVCTWCVYTYPHKYTNIHTQ